MALQSNVSSIKIYIRAYKYDMSNTNHHILSLSKASCRRAGGFNNISMSPVALFHAESALRPVWVTSSLKQGGIAFDLDDGTASLDLAREVARYYELSDTQAREIIKAVGKAVSGWRKEAARLGLVPAQIDRVASAFEHDDLEAAIAL
jgi:hypothetical protein